MPGDRQHLEALAYEAQVLEQQRQMIAQRVMQAQEAVAQISVAIETIRSVKSGSKTFVPVGAGAMMPAKIESGDVLVEAGAGAVIEMKPNAAITLLESRVKKMAEFQSSAEKDAIKLEQRLQALNAQARSLMGKMKVTPPSEMEG